MANKVILTGNVGKDPEVKAIGDNNKVANFTLATVERGYKTKTGKEIPDKTTWHNLVVWNSLAEIAEKHIKKGTRLYIEGKIDNRSYDDTNGVKKYISEIIVTGFEFIGAKNNDSSAPADAAQTKDEDDLPF